MVHAADQTSLPHRSQPRFALLACVMLVWNSLCPCIAVASDAAVLNPAKFEHYASDFIATQEETVTNAIPDAEAWQWMSGNVPFFECPDAEVERIYYFRWWTFRKHIVKTPREFVLTEFLKPVNHAGPFNTISCAAGFQIAEGRWLRNPRYLDDYIQFWLRGNDGRPQPHFHKYSSWFTAAAWERAVVSGDLAFLQRFLGDLVRDYEAWEREHRLPNGMLWQYDVRDGMEESISGSRTKRNIRPTINSYMFANARAIAALARSAGKGAVAREYERKARSLADLVQRELWDDSAKFFKVKLDDGSLSSAREAIGFIPWMFSLPQHEKGFEVAWAQLIDSQGFRAPYGITTAERRHPEFRSHGIGTCEWDGAVWPFATSQTLLGLANVLHDYTQAHVTRADYFDAFLTYVRSHHHKGQPWIGEYMDEITGEWINGKDDRSRYYNHSLFADLLVTGLIGLRPRLDQTLVVQPLIPPGAWDWFCLDAVPYHGRTLTILWDREGTRYGRGQGLRVFADGKELAATDDLRPVRAKLGGDKK